MTRGQARRAKPHASRLRSRIANTGSSTRQAQDEKTAVSVSGSAASPAAPDVMPLAQVLLYPEPREYATVAYRGLHPVYTADGAAVPATSPGRWAQLAAAGRP